MFSATLNFIRPLLMSVNSETELASRLEENCSLKENLIDRLTNEIASHSVTVECAKWALANLLLYGLVPFSEKHKNMSDVLTNFRQVFEHTEYKRMSWNDFVVIDRNRSPSERLEKDSTSKSTTVQRSRGSGQSSQSITMSTFKILNLASKSRCKISRINIDNSIEIWKDFVLSRVGISETAYEKLQRERRDVLCLLYNYLSLNVSSTVNKVHLDEVPHTHDLCVLMFRSILEAVKQGASKPGSARKDLLCLDIMKYQNIDDLKLEMEVCYSTETKAGVKTEQTCVAGFPDLRCGIPLKIDRKYQNISILNAYTIVLSTKKTELKSLLKTAETRFDAGSDDPMTQALNCNEWIDLKKQFAQIELDIALVELKLKRQQLKDLEANKKAAVEVLKAAESDLLSVSETVHSPKSLPSAQSASDRRRAKAKVGAATVAVESAEAAIKAGETAVSNAKRDFQCVCLHDYKQRIQEIKFPQIIRANVSSVFKFDTSHLDYDAWSQAAAQLLALRDVVGPDVPLMHLLTDGVGCYLLLLKEKVSKADQDCFIQVPCAVKEELSLLIIIAHLGLDAAEVIEFIETHKDSEVVVSGSQAGSTASSAELSDAGARKPPSRGGARSRGSESAGGGQNSVGFRVDDKQGAKSGQRKCNAEVNDEEDEEFDEWEEEGDEWEEEDFDSANGSVECPLDIAQQLLESVSAQAETSSSLSIDSGKQREIDLEEAKKRQEARRIEEERLMERRMYYWKLEDERRCTREVC